MELVITNYQDKPFKVVTEKVTNEKLLHCQIYRANGTGENPYDYREMGYEDIPCGEITLGPVNCNINDRDSIKTYLEYQFNDRMSFIDEIEPEKDTFIQKDMAKEKSFPYYKITLKALARIIMAIGDLADWTEKERFKFSTSPFDLGLNYFVTRTKLHGEEYIIVYAPSITANALLFDEVAYDENYYSDTIREFLQSQKYEEDRLDTDEMVYVERSVLKTICTRIPDLDFKEDDVKIYKEKPE